jgi:hypothetical protein
MSSKFPHSLAFNMYLFSTSELVILVLGVRKSYINDLNKHCDDSEHCPTDALSIYISTVNDHSKYKANVKFIC